MMLLQETNYRKLFIEEAEDVFAKQEGVEEVEHDRIKKEFSEQGEQEVKQKLCEEDPLQADSSFKAEMN